MLKLEFDFEFYQKFGLGLENRLQEPEQLADTARSQAIYYRIFLRNYRAQMSIIRTIYGNKKFTKTTRSQTPRWHQVFLCRPLLAFKT